MPFLQVTEQYRREILIDTFMLHLISHRPKEALQRLENMAEGGGVEIEAGGVPPGFTLCFVCALLRCMTSYIGLNPLRHKLHLLC